MSALSFDRTQDARPLDRDEGSDEDDDGPVAPNWEPASRDADPTSGGKGGGDILSMLVSIYGSKVRSYLFFWFGLCRIGSSPVYSVGLGFYSVQVRFCLGRFGSVGFLCIRGIDGRGVGELN